MASLIQVSITLDSDQADAVVGRLFDAGIQGVELVDSDTDIKMGLRTEIRVYHPADSIDDLMETYASLLPDDHVLAVNQVSGSWRHSLDLNAVELGERFSINDHANQYPDRKTLFIDVGSGFGDGIKQPSSV